MSAGLQAARLGFEAYSTPYGQAWMRVVSLPPVDAPPATPAGWAQALAYAHPGPWAFLDLESTGRRRTASTYAFLVGLVVWRADQPPRLHQWLLPHPADEAALWHHVVEHWPSSAVLFTYNGARFDVPLLDTRAQAVGLSHRPWAQARHVDLLSWVRRLFRGAWPDQRLRTAAERLLGRRAFPHDVPASALPELYHHALLTGDVTPLAPAVAHNQADLEILLALWPALGRELAHLPRGARYPATTWLSRARLYRQHGDAARAQAALERAFRQARTPQERAQAGLALADAYRRAQQQDAALAVWEALAAEGVWEAYEQRIRAALRWARDPEQARAWLRRVQAHLAAASTSPLDRALWGPRFAKWAERLGDAPPRAKS